MSSTTEEKHDMQDPTPTKMMPNEGKKQDDLAPITATEPDKSRNNIDQTNNNTPKPTADGNGDDDDNVYTEQNTKAGEEKSEGSTQDVPPKAATPPRPKPKPKTPQQSTGLSKEGGVLEQFVILSKTLKTTLENVKEHTKVLKPHPEAKTFWVGLASQAKLMEKIALLLRLRLTKEKKEHAKTKTDLRLARDTITNLESSIKELQQTPEITNQNQETVECKEEKHDDDDAKHNQNTTINDEVDVEPEVSTVAGGVQGFEDGVGEAAMFNYPCSVFFHGKELYVADKDNCAVRKISNDSTVTTILSYKNFKSGDENNLNAQSEIPPICPRGVARDANGVTYIADLANHRIWKLSQDGTVDSFAGSRVGYADGKGSEAQFNCPCISQNHS